VTFGIGGQNIRSRTGAMNCTMWGRGVDGAAWPAAASISLAQAPLSSGLLGFGQDLRAAVE